MPSRSEENEPMYRTLSDPVERRGLPRIAASWPVTIITENGPVEAETRNITLEGVFIHCMERLSVNETYRLVIKPPGKEIKVMGKLLWSNLEGATGRDSLQAMGFCFVKVNEVHREFLREAFLKYGKE
jgi:PilZ domain